MEINKGYTTMHDQPIIKEEIVSKCRILFADLKDMDTDCILWMQLLHLDLVYPSAASCEICLIVRRVRAKSGVLALSVCPFVRLSVRLHGTTRLPFDGFSLSFILECFFFENSLRKFKSYWNITRTMDTLHADQYTFSYHISFSPSWSKKRFEQKLYRKSKHKSCSITFFFLENLIVREIMWKSIVDPGRPQMTIWHMRIAFWMPKATHTPNME